MHEVSFPDSAIRRTSGTVENKSQSHKPDIADLDSSIKHSCSVTEATMVTLGSEFLSEDGTQHLDEGEQDPHHEEEEDGFDDSLSSVEEDQEQHPHNHHRDSTPIATNFSNSTDESRFQSNKKDTIMSAGLSKIPSSLHIPSACSSSSASCLEEEEKHEEEPLQDDVNPADDDQQHNPVRDDLSKSTPVTSSRRTSFGPMVHYKPSDRSIDVALAPAKPVLRRGSSYGKDVTIPLDFKKRGSVRVLPKPDIKSIQREASKRISSCPQFQTTSSLTTGVSKVRNQRRRVSFNTIAIREHKITMGDNPSCSYGTPISLDWDYTEFEELSLQDYELEKIQQGRGKTRTVRQLYLNHYQRRNRLKFEGYTEEEIKARKHEINKVRKERNLTKFLAQAKVLVTLEDMVESAGRKVQRAMKKKQSSHVQYSFKKTDDDTTTEDEKHLLLKIMEGDDTIETARSTRGTNGHTKHHDNLMPISIKPIEG